MIRRLPIALLLLAIAGVSLNACTQDVTRSEQADSSTERAHSAAEETVLSAEQSDTASEYSESSGEQPPSTELIAASSSELATELGKVCEPVAEVLYRSQEIVSSDGRHGAYIEGRLRKLTDEYDVANGAGSEEFCHGTAETVGLQIVVDGQNAVEILSEPFDEAYIIYEARSLSADNRYLAAEANTVWNGVSTRVTPAFFNLETGEAVQTPVLCDTPGQDDYSFITFAGFLRDETAVVLCEDEGFGAGDQYVLLDLATGSRRVLPQEPTNLRFFGTVEGEFNVIDSQTP